METNVQGEVFVFGGFKRRMKYLGWDVLSFVGFLGVLWLFIGRIGYENGDVKVMVGTVFIAFCIHMATFRIFFSQLAIINGIKALLQDRFDMDSDKSYEALTSMLGKKPVTAQLKTGKPVRLTITEDKNGKIELHIAKVGL
ncbi:MAG: hypothetical protein H9W81_01140 [Enterococcus sp.]|nr:hypothetical protein [Enterococcus sp.]